MRTLGSGKDFTKRTLESRLDDFSFELATQLRAKNLEKCLKFEKGRKELRKFYGLSFNEQRERIAKLGKKLHDFDPNILKALRNTKREIFVPKKQRILSYIEAPTWVSGLNGITPPLFCGKAAELINMNKQKDENILVIGSGEGYSSAFFSECAGKNTNILGLEIDSRTAERSQRKLKDQGYDNVRIEVGDAFEERKDIGNFDRIWTTLAVKKVPAFWVNSLKKGGIIGIFRKLKRGEFERALEEGFLDLENYRDYEENWWESVCLEILFKNSEGEIGTKKRIYNVFNAPFWNEKYGDKTDINWSERYGKIQRKIINFLNKK